MDKNNGNGNSVSSKSIKAISYNNRHVSNNGISNKTMYQPIDITLQ